MNYVCSVHIFLHALLSQLCPATFTPDAFGWSTFPSSSPTCLLHLHFLIVSPSYIYLLIFSSNALLPTATSGVYLVALQATLLLIATQICRLTSTNILYRLCRSKNPARTSIIQRMFTRHIE